MPRTEKEKLPDLRAGGKTKSWKSDSKIPLLYHIPARIEESGSSRVSSGSARVSRPQVRRGSVRRGSPDPAETPDRRSPHSAGDLRSAAWLGRRPAATAADRPQRSGPGSARVSRPRRNTRPKVSPFSRRPSVGGVARSETGRNSGGPATTAARSETGRNGLRFGAGLQTPPKHPTEGLPIPQETFGRRRGSVGDRPQQRRTGHNGLRFGAGLQTPPKHPTEGLPIPQETFGWRRGSVGDRPQQAETGRNSGDRPTTAAFSRNDPFNYPSNWLRATIATRDLRRLFPPTIAIGNTGRVEGKAEDFSDYLDGLRFGFWTCRDKMEVHQGNHTLF